jgi:hypothetical protein
MMGVSVPWAAAGIAVDSRDSQVNRGDIKLESPDVGPVRR